jgi:hypothetical protein
MTAALEGGDWSAARPGRTLPLGKTRYPFYRRLGGPQGPSGRAEDPVPTGIPSPGHPACSQSLYRLSYPGPQLYASISDKTLQSLSILVSKFYYVSNFSTIRHYFPRSQNECKKGMVLCKYTALQLLLKLNTHVLTFMLKHLLQHIF